MTKKITSTKLKNKTREIIDEVYTVNEPTVVYTHQQPKVVLLNYDTWVKDNERKKRKFSNLEKYKVKSKKIIDSTKYIRKMRDE